MSLLDAWLALFPDHPTANGIGEDLIARWSEPQRRYHTTDHLAFMLSVVDGHASAADDITAVRLAAWFHDIVYDPTRIDNELRSAECASTALGALGVETDRLAEVIRLIWLTTDHRVEPEDHNGALLCDADLAILAVAPDEYASYARAVRSEYAHVPDDAYRAGRIAVLAKLLDLPQLYHVPALRDAWEARARAQVTAEISALRASGAADQPR
jgi:predicted metal-dependent HD superfamily phosphohydrolase